MIKVQVVYALPEKPTVIDCRVDDQTTVLQAITQSGILSLHNLTLTDHPVGIFGKQVLLTDPLTDGDRIEIYRPLINDPKEIRRQRAAERQKRMR
ncbi:RnfH family protein [Orbus sasakiae]|uniref:UPF0125 protein GCM10023211_01720 n=1 Tax=Orbus sasakiae TaxID=1078475 RepID=A0ABP9MYD7_9GAMM